MKRFSTIFFTLLLLVLLAACGGNGETSSSPPPASNIPGSSDMVEDQEAEGPLATPTPPSSAQDTVEPSPTPSEPTSTPSGSVPDQTPSTPIPDAPVPAPPSSVPDDPKTSPAPSQPVPSPNPSAPAAPTETPPENPSKPEPSEPEDEEKSTALQIQVQGNQHTTIFELNDSPAAHSLYNQLPLSIEVQGYSTNEKIFYPPEALDTTDAIAAEGPAGTLAYFSPWGNVVMYYSSCGPYSGLYELGNAISGGEWIEELSGTLQIQQVHN